jgi:hypothetical protein
VTDSLVLIVVAWLVYVSDALWWVKPERVVLSGRTPGRLRAQLGPTYVLRGEGGVFLPRPTPPFDNHFEVDVTATGRKRSAEAIVAAAEAAVTAARPLLQLGAVLWCYCFVTAPLLIVTFGLSRVWPLLLIGLFALALIVVTCFARQWRVLRPQNPGGWKEHAVPMILSPVAAICAADTLTRSACASFDGLAVVAARAAGDDFIRIARLQYFSPEDATSAATSRLESIVDRSVLAAILKPPLPESEAMKGYCPRCHTQLVRESGDCPECHRIGIVPFGIAMPSGASFDTSRSVVQR